jgi:hypothetical protein
MNKWSSKLLAIDIVKAIQTQTKKGFDKDGKKFKEYSERPFAMPYQAITRKSKADPYLIWLSELNAHNSNKKTSSKVGKAKGVKYLAKTQTGKKYIKVLWWGGYKDYKKTMYDTDTVNLSASEAMISSFGVLNVREEWKQESIFEGQKFMLPIPEIYIKLGWSDDTQAQKAYWNIKRGRNMLGLPQKKLNNLVRGFVRAYITGK